LAESDGHLVGHVRLLKVEHDEYDRVVVRGIVHPGWRRQGIGAALMRRAAERAEKLKTERPMVLHLSVRERVSGAAELALSLDFHPERYFFYMERHHLEQLPEPIFPAGIRLRDYVMGQDMEPFVQAHNDGFADHWGFAASTLEQEEHRSRAPGFRAQDNLLTVGADGLIVGFCVLQFAPAGPDQTDSPPPLIDDLAVRPAFRRRGIGTALLLAAMHRVRGTGRTTVSLVVDADNPNQALRLYESVGFAVQSRTTVYQKEVR
jgi:mycothiol synthase